jgi:pimeloyl-ACP methyl ester carboxylesterase
VAYRSEILDVRGVRTHLLRGGRGRPLLVLHPEFAARTWAPYHDALAAQFQVFAPDHPGFGDSERPEWLDGIEDLVFHYVDLLDALELERVSIVGTSLGGWIALALALHHPGRVERLVLAAPAGVRVDGIERYDYFANPIEETLRRLFHDPSRAYHEFTTLARLSWNPYLYDPKLQQRLPRLRPPTLLIWGADDRVLAPSHGDLFAELIPSATLTQIPQCGHFPPLERADVFAKLAVEFLSA